MNSLKMMGSMFLPSWQRRNQSPMLVLLERSSILCSGTVLARDFILTCWRPGNTIVRRRYTCWRKVTMARMMNQNQRKK